MTVSWKRMAFFFGSIANSIDRVKGEAKMATQSLALTKVAASTWGATLNKARQVYTAVVRPSMTYGATVWHSPSSPPAAKLATLQNKCLRAITGAYRATKIKSLRGRGWGGSAGYSPRPNGIRVKRNTKTQRGY